MQTGKMAVMTAPNQPLELREYPLTPPVPGMAQLELLASGVCGTDIHFLKGKIPAKTPMAIGHEFVGRVMALGSPDPAGVIQPGDAAIVDIACPCGKCPLCEHGDDANCLHMGVTNGGDPAVPPHFYGGYGEYNYSPVANLIRIPAELDPRMVSVFACAGPTGLHAFRLAGQAGVDLKTARVAVVQGLGPVGCFAVLYLASLGIEHIVAVSGRDLPQRRELALKLGATQVLSLEKEGEQAVIDAVRQLNGMGADLVFEASGNPAAVPQGMAMLRNRGTYLVPGQYSNSGTVAISPQLITFQALHIIGSSQYSMTDVEEYLAFLSANPACHDIIRSLITAYPIAQVNQAIADTAAGKTVKTILVK